MTGTNKAQSEREKYVRAFNSTMVKIWLEQQALLGTIRTGALYQSTVAVSMTHDEKFLSIELVQAFNTYGLFVDRGTGREIARGNGGDLGFTPNRKAKPWFSRKYYASVMNIQEFYANNVGRDFCKMVADAFSPKFMTRSMLPA